MKDICDQIVTSMAKSAISIIDEAVGKSEDKVYLNSLLYRIEKEDLATLIHTLEVKHRVENILSDFRNISGHHRYHYSFWDRNSNSEPVYDPSKKCWSYGKEWEFYEKDNRLKLEIITTYMGAFWWEQRCHERKCERDKHGFYLQNNVKQLQYDSYTAYYNSHKNEYHDYHTPIFWGHQEHNYTYPYELGIAPRSTNYNKYEECAQDLAGFSRIC